MGWRMHFYVLRGVGWSRVLDIEFFIRPGLGFTVPAVRAQTGCWTESGVLLVYGLYRVQIPD